MRSKKAPRSPVITYIIEPHTVDFATALKLTGMKPAALRRALLNIGQIPVRTSDGELHDGPGRQPVQYLINWKDLKDWLDAQERTTTLREVLNG